MMTTLRFHTIMRFAILLLVSAGLSALLLGGLTSAGAAQQEVAAQPLVAAQQAALVGGSPLPPLPDWGLENYLYTTSVAWGDADGDGDLDLVVGNYWGPNQIFLNDGEGNFSVSTLQVYGNYTTSVAWGDADGDGDLDLVVGN